MFKKRFKPTAKKIDLSRTIAQDIEFFCKTSVLDEILCRKLKREYNKELAEGQEQFVRFYLVVKKNYEYDIISGEIVEPYLKEHKIEELSETIKSRACMHHYIDKCYQDFK